MAKSLLDGREVRYRGSHLFLIERSLDEIAANPVKSYLEEHADALDLRRMQQAFPRLGDVTKREMLFFDIETCGLSYLSPICAIGMTHLNHNISASCLFARDYSEEKGVLQYFLGQLKNYQAFYTFNGMSFDLPRLNQRMKANGLRCSLKNAQDTRSLKEIINPRHIDLMLALKEHGIRLPNYTLQTAEKVLFKMARSRDARSGDIPGIYRNYIFGKDSEKDIELALNHAIIDTLTLPALVAYLVEKKKK